MCCDSCDSAKARRPRQFSSPSNNAIKAASQASAIRMRRKVRHVHNHRKKRTVVLRSIIEEAFAVFIGT